MTFQTKYPSLKKTNQIWQQVKHESRVDHYTPEYRPQKLYPFYTLSEIGFLSFFVYSFS
jgi:hypothetical protein